MKNKQLMFLCLIFLVSVVVVVLSCKKDSNRPLNLIDVSSQWETGDIYEIIDSLNDGQWRLKTFNQTEDDLFSSLDTTNLTGTTAPDSLLSKPFPICGNPFNSGTALPFRFSNEYGGQLVCKYVIVDSLFNPIVKVAERIQANKFVDTIYYMHSFSTGLLTIRPNIPIGRFRMYYTLSSETNENIFKTWGNIRKIL